MDTSRSLTLHFMDGTSMSFDFPEQTKNTAAKQLKLESFRDSNHILVEADGSLLMFPLVNIKYLQLTTPGALPYDEARPPKDLIQGASLRG